MVYFFAMRVAQRSQRIRYAADFFFSAFASPFRDIIFAIFIFPKFDFSLVGLRLQFLKVEFLIHN